MHAELTAPPRHRPKMAIPEAAAYVGTSERHLRHLIDRRLLAVYRLGGRILIDPEDADRFLERARCEAVL